MRITERHLIELARQSPNWFANYVLGLRQGDVHKAFQHHLTIHDSCYIEFHRGCGKTTQLSAVRLCWELGRDPSLRIKYIQQNEREPKKTVGAMKSIIESERFEAIFPECRPDPDMWGMEAFKVRNASFTRDPSVEACSIFGRAGGRADILCGDDVCDWKNSIKSPSDRESVKDAWKTNWLPMRDWTQDRRPRTWSVGTPYHVDDLTQEWRKIHKAKGSLLRLPVVKGCSPWPEVFTPELLDEIRIDLGPIAFGRAMELNPISSESLIFPADWLDEAMFTGDIPKEYSEAGQMVATFDFAFTEKKQKNDPDFSVCLIGWASARGHLFVIDSLATQSSFPEFKRRSLAKCKRWRVVSGAAEANGPQRGIAQQLNREAPFPISYLERDLDKITRAAQKQSFVESGRLHIRGKSVQFGQIEPTRPMQPLYDQMVTFPASGHDDYVDAVMDLCDFALKPTAIIADAVPETDSLAKALEAWD